MDWTALIGPVAGILIVVVDRWLQRRKMRAEASKTLAEADLVRLERKIKESDFWERLCHDIEAEYAKLSERQDELKNQVDALSKDLATMKHVILKMWRGMDVLLRQLHDNHITPDWEPDAEMVEYCRALAEEEPRA